MSVFVGAPQPLSGSSFGMGIPVTATSSPGNTVHTAQSGTGGSDKIYLWVSNVTSSPRKLTVQYGGTSDVTDDLVYQGTVPPNTLQPILICDGLLLQDGLLIKAWADVASALNIFGHILPITN